MPQLESPSTATQILYATQRPDAKYIYFKKISGMGVLDSYEPRLELYNWQLGIKHMPVLGK